MGQIPGYNVERINTWIARAAAQRKKALAVQSSKRKADFKKWIALDLKTGASAAHALVKDKSPVKFVTPPCAEESFKAWAAMWHDERFRIDVSWPVQLEQLVEAAEDVGL